MKRYSCYWYISQWKAKLFISLVIARVPSSPFPCRAVKFQVGACCALPKIFFIENQDGGVRTLTYRRQAWGGCGVGYPLWIWLRGLSPILGRDFNCSRCLRIGNMTWSPSWRTKSVSMGHLPSCKYPEVTESWWGLCPETDGNHVS